ncbi:hypothetical protein CCMA1212_005405 [Trichoderma ghanense]|uniref:CFEM domain-containing protein n=1 Tax=Trichoderma ghanense TaxID=65468 RepID=A0ABY2H3T9_9HYPO
MHSTLVFLLGLAILGSASPLAGVTPFRPATRRHDNMTIVHDIANITVVNNVANKTLASHSTNSTIISLSVAAAAAAPEDPPANPPSINDLPPCCVPCVKEGIEKETQCALEDVACICENKTKIGKAAKDCVVDKCGLNTAISKFYPFFSLRRGLLMRMDGVELVGPAVKKLCNMDDDDVEVESWEEA